MFERYTEAARRTLFYARLEALKSASARVEPEHLLLGLLQVDPPLIRHFLKSDEVIDALRLRLIAPKSAAASSLDPPLSDASKRALAYSAEKAERLGVGYIGTEHLLAGLLREEDSRAAQALRQAGIELSLLRALLQAKAPAALTLAKEDLHWKKQLRRKEGLHRLIEELPPELWNSAENALRSVRNGVFDRYTEQARRTIFFARYEASRFGAESIESEHLLLSHMRQHSRLTDRLFETGTHPSEIRKEIEQRKPPAERAPTSVDLPISQECNRALAFATEEADRLNHKHIGNEHLLAGLLREENCLAAELLRAHGITLDAARRDLEKGDSAA